MHDPSAVASHELGAENAAVYPEWAWSLDPAGAGWSTTPLDLLPMGGSVGAAKDEADCMACSLPSGWPDGIQYAPFLLWETQPAAIALRLRSVAFREDARES